MTKKVIIVDGQVYETEKQSTYSVGSWNGRGIPCTPGFLKSDTLFCNGYFAYDITSTSGVVSGN